MAPNVGVEPRPALEAVRNALLRALHVLRRSAWQQLPLVGSNALVGLGAWQGDLRFEVRRSAMEFERFADVLSMRDGGRWMERLKRSGRWCDALGWPRARLHEYFEGRIDRFWCE